MTYRGTGIIDMLKVSSRNKLNQKNSRLSIKRENGTAVWSITAC